MLTELKVIRKPEDQESVTLLQEKLTQYVEWKDKLAKDSQTIHPDLRDDTSNMQRSYTLRILKEIISNGQVNVPELVGILQEEQKERFEPQNFENACLTVDAFTKDVNFLRYSIDSEEIRKSK